VNTFGIDGGDADGLGQHCEILPFNADGHAIDHTSRSSADNSVEDRAV